MDEHSITELDADTTKRLPRMFRKVSQHIQHAIIHWTSSCSTCLVPLLVPGHEFERMNGACQKTKHYRKPVVCSYTQNLSNPKALRAFYPAWQTDMHGLDGSRSRAKPAGTSDFSKVCNVVFG